MPIDADTRRNSYPKDEFLYASPAIGFGDQGASIDPVEMCGRCHGDDGKGGATHGEAPNLTLQSADYLKASLEAYAYASRHPGIGASRRLKRSAQDCPLASQEMQAECRFAVFGLGHTVAEIQQHLGGGHADQRVVLDQQHTQRALPFLLRRVGEAPAWVVRTAFVIWYAGIAALAWVAWQLRTALTRNSASVVRDAVA